MNADSLPRLPGTKRSYAPAKSCLLMSAHSLVTACRAAWASAGPVVTGAEVTAGGVEVTCPVEAWDARCTLPDERAGLAGPTVGGVIGTTAGVVLAAGRDPAANAVVTC